MEKDDTILKKLIEISGKENVKTSQEDIALYASDQSLTPKSRPHYVVFPKKSNEVQDIIKFANEQKIPVVPRSSKVSLHGGSIPTEGGILVDLTKMNNIIEINERNRYAVIEPGVTFAQLSRELDKKGFTIAKPFLDPPSASVVSSFMERNPVSAAADFTFGTEHIMTYTVISPTGEPFTIGHPPLKNTPASSPDGPGLNFYRIFQGAQGTLGIVTWMIIRVLPKPKAQKVFFYDCDTVEQAVNVISRIQKSELGLECFALNDFNLAALLLDETGTQKKSLIGGNYIGINGAENWDESQYEQFNEIHTKLPSWTVVLCLSAVGPIPQEKIDYQEIDLKEISVEIGIEPKPTVGGIANLDKLILEEIFLSWRMQKRFGYRGSCQQVMFMSSPDRVGEFNETVHDVVGQFNYPLDDIGMFLLPMERGRAFYMSVDLHCDLDDKDETNHLRELFDSLSEALVREGAFFDRPYGKWSELVYSRVGKYAEYLRKIKNELDPNNIMNPGKLCF